MKIMGILLNGYDLTKSFRLKRNFIYRLEKSVKNAYHIVGDSIKKTPTIIIG